MGENDNNVYGASETNIMNDPYAASLGVLSGGKGAEVQALLNSLMPEPEKVDAAQLAIRFFSQMGANAAQPGSTALSAAASALPSAADYLAQVNKRNKELERARGPLAIQLASAIKPPTNTTIESLTKRAELIGLVPGSDEYKDFIATGGKTTKNTTIETLEKRAELGGLIKGTPEFNAFMLSGGTSTKNTTMDALKERAKLGGLEEGTKEYQEFMISGGKTPSGFSLVSDGEGGFTFTQGVSKTGKVDKGYVQIKNQDGTFEQQVIPGSIAFQEIETKKLGFDADIGDANVLITAVEGIIGRPQGDGLTAIQPNPNLPSILGSIQGRLPAFIDQEKQDLLIKIEFLSSNAFMEAFKSLKGGGQITEKEGDAATAALARLSRTQSVDAFTQGLNEFLGIIKRGRDKANQLKSSLPKIAGTITGNSDIPLDFESMNNQQLKLVDPESLSREELEAFRKILGIK